MTAPAAMLGLATVAGLARLRDTETAAISTAIIHNLKVLVSD